MMKNTSDFPNFTEFEKNLEKNLNKVCNHEENLLY